MELVDGYPIIVTDRLRECRDFYGDWFGFQVAFEADWIVVLSSPGERAVTVADARLEHERLVAAGLRCDLELTDEPWGQRRFGVTDPAGMWVDVVEQIEPAPGWWEPYLRWTK